MNHWCAWEQNAFGILRKKKKSRNKSEVSQRLFHETWIIPCTLISKYTDIDRGYVLLLKLSKEILRIPNCFN